MDHLGVKSEWNVYLFSFFSDPLHATIVHLEEELVYTQHTLNEQLYEYKADELKQLSQNVKRSE